jgi:hypothetical protein
LSKVNPKSLKALVQKCGRSGGKFENRLLGPTNYFNPIILRHINRGVAHIVAG